VPSRSVVPALTTVVLSMVACGFDGHGTNVDTIDAPTDGPMIDTPGDDAPDAPLPMIDAGPDPTLVAAFSFDEMNPTVIDHSMYANNGGYFQGAMTGTGHTNNGAVFDGSDDYIEIPNSASLDIGGTALTIEFWARFDGNDNSDDVVLGKFHQDGMVLPLHYQWGVEFNDNQSDSIDFFFTDTNGIQHQFVGVGTTGTTHVAFTYDGATVKQYLNGQFVQSLVVIGVIETRGQILRMGVDATKSQPFAGMLDDVRIYKRVLTQPEIASDRMTPVH
jgi:hypothetical protein